MKANKRVKPQIMLGGGSGDPMGYLGFPIGLVVVGGPPVPRGVPAAGHGAPGIPGMPLGSAPGAAAPGAAAPFGPP